MPQEVLLSEDKPRVRIPARKAFVTDSFQNFEARVGIGTGNQSTSSTYGFNPITRNRLLLEWMYRGSWLAQIAVDAVADDMTRAGVQILSDMDADEVDELNQGFNDDDIWGKLNEACSWSRLYGGAIAVMLIDGQDMEESLNIDSIDKDQFKGLVVFDRWQLQPALLEVVTELGPDMGLPLYYNIVDGNPIMAGKKIHYSRCIRLEGNKLPFWQKQQENGWGMSIIETLYDRMVAFDSTTQGAAQLVYKAHLRILKIEGFRDALATSGGQVFEGMARFIDMIRRFQSNEGLTVLDAKDTFEANSYQFSGLSDIMLQFGQQLSGATQIPLVRLFGQSPTGMNATGESDLRNYYDGINSKQKRVLKRPIGTLLDVMHRSKVGKPLPNGFGFEFTPLWQLSETEKSEIAERDSTSVGNMVSEGIIGRKTALQELRASSRVTGRFSKITDEEIKDAELDPPSGETAMGSGGEGLGPGSGGPSGREEERAEEGGEDETGASSFDLGDD